MLQENLENEVEYTDENLPLTHDRIALRANSFYEDLDDWEKNWIKSTKNNNPEPQGDEIKIVKATFEKYQPLIKEYFQ